MAGGSARHMPRFWCRLGLQVSLAEPLNGSLVFLLVAEWVVNLGESDDGSIGLG